MAEITLVCPCACPGSTFITVSVPAGMTGEQVRQAWKDDAAAGGHTSQCSLCGCVFGTSDDGTAASAGGSINQPDKSAPRLDSLGATKSGPPAGATSITLNGHSFNTMLPDVKVDGVAATSVVVTADTTLTCDTPAGKIVMQVVKTFMKLAHGSVTGGPFTVGEVVEGNDTTDLATVKEVQAAYLLVEITGGEFLDTEGLTGQSSSATATMTADQAGLQFQVGDVVTGVTSGHTATIDSLTPIKTSNPSGGFTGGEEVTGGTSLARGELHATVPLDGKVDVTISNSNGQRPERLNHGTVTGGPFQRGEKVTDSAGETTVVYQVVEDPLAGDYLIVEHTSNEFSAGTLTGADSGATASFTSLTGGRLARAFEYTA